MGEVYEGRDTRLDRTVAIKVLPEALAADPLFRERFDREARIIFLARSSGASPPPIAKLLDFGLARTAPALTVNKATMMPTTPPQAMTAQGTILGTFQYMAPEQVEGGEADARTDIFSLGSVLYEMLTGKKAFEGKTQTNLVAAILERDPPPLSTLRPLAPPLVDSIVRKCLAKNPDDRWQTASDLGSALRWAAEGANTTVSGASAVVVTPRTGPRRVARGALMAVGILGAVA